MSRRCSCSGLSMNFADGRTWQAAGRQMLLEHVDGFDLLCAGRPMAGKCRECLAAGSRIQAQEGASEATKALARCPWHSISSAGDTRIEQYPIADSLTR